MSYTEACLTFDQFASNSTDYLERNTTFYFLEGNHTFISELSIENVTTFACIATNEVKVIGIALPLYFYLGSGCFVFRTYKNV